MVNHVEKAVSFEVKNIKPEDIEYVTSLKDKSATDKYGEKGRNGVIEITTKKNRCTL